MGPDASCQFAGQRGIWFRIIRVHDWPAWEGMAWLDGYELLDRDGIALERRTIYVRVAGLRRPALANLAPDGKKRPTRP